MTSGECGQFGYELYSIRGGVTVPSSRNELEMEIDYSNPIQFWHEQEFFKIVAKFLEGITTNILGTQKTWTSFVINH